MKLTKHKYNLITTLIESYLIEETFEGMPKVAFSTAFLGLHGIAGIKPLKPITRAVERHGMGWDGMGWDENATAQDQQVYDLPEEPSRTM